jgi:hypothetical protein
MRLGLHEFSLVGHDDMFGRGSRMKGWMVGNLEEASVGLFYTGFVVCIGKFGNEIRVCHCHCFIGDFRIRVFFFFALDSNLFWALVFLQAKRK